MTLSFDPPLVSVIMPAFNYERYVADAVTSVFQQTYQNVELIAVDDGSTDSTVSILDRLASDAPIDMRVVRGEHGGVCAAMNLGLRNANGDLISILHADDCYLPRKVEMQVEAFNTSPRPYLVHCDYRTIDDQGREVVGLDSSLDRPAALGDALRLILLGRSDVRSMTLMYPRHAMLKAGGYDEALPQEDWQSILRLSASGPVAHVPETLVLRRVHRSSTSVLKYRARSFSIDEIAPTVLQDVVPVDLDLGRIAGDAVGTLARNAIAEGNLKRARLAIQAGWSAYPTGRRRMLGRAASGFPSLLWMQWLAKWLPESVVARLRRSKARVRSRRMAPSRRPRGRRM